MRFQIKNNFYHNLKYYIYCHPIVLERYNNANYIFNLVRACALGPLCYCRWGRLHDIFFCRRLNQTMNDTLFDFAQVLTIMVAEKLGLMHFFTQKFIF